MFKHLTKIALLAIVMSNGSGCIVRPYDGYGYYYYDRYPSASISGDMIHDAIMMATAKYGCTHVRYLDARRKWCPTTGRVELYIYLGVCGSAHAFIFIGSVGDEHQFTEIEGEL